MTKQVVWAFREFFFLQFDTKFASKQRLPKIGNILWLFDVVLDFASLTHHAAGRNAECDMHGLERPLRIWATQCLQCFWMYTAVWAILTFFTNAYQFEFEWTDLLWQSEQWSIRVNYGVCVLGDISLFSRVSCPKWVKFVKSGSTSTVTKWCQSWLILVV